MGGIVALIASLLGVNRGLATAISLGTALVLGSGVIWGGYELVKHWGAQEALEKIDDQNNKAGIEGSKARMSLVDCDRRDGVYNFRTGECIWS